MKKPEKALRPAEKPVMPQPNAAAKPWRAKPAAARKPAASHRAGRRRPSQAAPVKASVAKSSSSGARGAALVSGAQPAQRAAKAPLIKSAVAKVKKEPRRSTLRPPPPPLMQYKFIGVPSFTGPKPAKYTVPPPPPPPPPPPAGVARRAHLARADAGSASRTRPSGSATSRASICRGFTTTARSRASSTAFQELRTAIDPSATVGAGLEHAAGLRRDPPAQAGASSSSATSRPRSASRSRSTS